MTKRRVVVTGLGMLTPLGGNVEQTWQNILSGRSGVGKVSSYDTTDFRVSICAEIKESDYDPKHYFDVKEARKLDTFAQYGIVAGEQALADAELTNIPTSLAHRVGIAMGSGIGGIRSIQDNAIMLHVKGPRKISPYFIPSCIINMLPGYLAIRQGIKGPNFSAVSACSTGSHNIAIAARSIAYGDADIMVVGGAEHASNELGMGGFAAVRALSLRNDEPELASRPWDKDRDGFVLGDGAGAMVLEEYQHAKARGARIYAELVGIGMSADAYHMTLPDEQGEGAISAMRSALADAQMSADEIDYINAHATSTPAGDELEATAIYQVFKSNYDKLAVSSTKSMIGHLLGAAGTVEAIFTILAIRDNIAPPTINLDNPDTKVTLNFVPHKAQEKTIRAALSNSFGFGGTNAALVFKEFISESNN